jgi:hypothetical protein
MFKVPEEAKRVLPRWSKDELQRNLSDYASRYGISRDELQMYSTSEYDKLSAMMEVAFSTPGLNSEAWDKLYERWHDATLISIFSVMLGSDWQTGNPEDEAGLWEDYHERFFNGRDEWLEKRPSR